MRIFCYAIYSRKYNGETQDYRKGCWRQSHKDET